MYVHGERSMWALAELIPWSQFEGVFQILKAPEVLDPLSQPKPFFKSVRHRHVKKTSRREPEVTRETTNQDQDYDDSENCQASLLFLCPEERCVKAYSRFTSLQAHLDPGTHKRQSKQKHCMTRQMNLYLRFKVNDVVARS